MTLRDYLKGFNPPLTLDDIAAAINRDKSTVSRVLAGHGCSRRTASRIEAWTKGQVRAADVLAAQHLDDDVQRRSA